MRIAGFLEGARASLLVLLHAFESLFKLGAPPDIFFLSPPRLTSAIDSSLHSCAGSSATGLDG
jgi:hypothetical protein